MHRFQENRSTTQRMVSLQNDYNDDNSFMNEFLVNSSGDHCADLQIGVFFCDFDYEGVFLDS